MRRVPHPQLRHRVLFGLAFVFAVRLAAPAQSAPTAGFVETWPGTSVQGWGGGATVNNPGSGGLGGAGDGFLAVSTSMVANLGTMSLNAPEYTGNWQAAGVVSVSLWLNDIGADEPLEIHFGIGNGSNFWQYNIGFSPPSQSWQEFLVDLSSDANWTRTHGAGTFAGALQTADRINLRHDLAPYQQNPDAIQGDFGIDNLTLNGASTPSRPTSWGRIKSLYR